MASLDAADVARALGLGAEYADWLASLEALPPPPGGLPLPQPALAPERLCQLGLEAVDCAELLAALPSPAAQPAVWWLLERAYARVRHDVGQIDAATKPWPFLPPQLGTLGRCFWVYVFLATVDDVRQWHAAQRVPDQVSWDTLADLGRHMRLYRRRTGHVGLDVPWWISLHFQGALYALGRLQFNPYRLHGVQASRLGEPFQLGDRVLGVHIPESGPLDPAACDASFQAAGRFFPEYLPAYASRIATCTSWLLDDQLLEYLPPESNIVRFQRRFELAPAARDADDILHFVFGRDPSALDTLEPRTTLEHAIVHHVRQGRHWRVRTGWLQLPERSEAPKGPFSLQAGPGPGCAR